MTHLVKTACIQLNSGPDIADNLAVCAALIREAAAEGAEMILTPENTCHMRTPQSAKLESSPPEEHHPGLPLFSDLAQELGIWLLAGSFSVRVADDKIANRSYLFSDHGEMVAFYDKIHLFDVDLPTGESHRESDLVRGGGRAVICGLPWKGAVLGMSICYDVRFPALYRMMAQHGATIMAVPSAFTVPTGMAHWESLLRARAIETGSYVLAPAQCGTHHGGRQTYGHAMIIGPWGDVIVEAEDEPDYIVASLDMDAVARARQAIPSLTHDREMTLDIIAG